MSTLSDIQTLKTRLNAELASRSGSGSLAGWSKAFTTTPDIDELTIRQQLSETLGYAQKDSSAVYSEGRVFNYNEINSAITALEAETTCSGLCVGFCSATCAGTGTGASCTDCTGNCTEQCSAECSAGCTDNCRSTCGSDCINTCSGICAGVCTDLSS